MSRTTIDFPSGYFDNALLDLQQVIEDAKLALEGVDFDTLVGTGFSGGVVIPALALALDKRYVLIRKETDDSHHGAGRLIGSLGQRWLFVDDFVSSGATRKRVLKKIETGASLQDFETEFVGDYLYRSRGFVPTEVCEVCGRLGFERWQCEPCNRKADEAAAADYAARIAATEASTAPGLGLPGYRPIL